MALCVTCHSAVLVLFLFVVFTSFIKLQQFCTLLRRVLKNKSDISFQMKQMGIILNFPVLSAQGG